MHSFFAGGGRGTFDQILANLAMNARDAIAGVGKVTIETKNVALDDAYCAKHEGSVPGEYVQLAVSDDGCGLDKEFLEHLFEPFFMSKGVGSFGVGPRQVFDMGAKNAK